MSANAPAALHGKAKQRQPRILVVRVGAMGDVIHALPAVAMLREALPQAHIGWAIEPRWSPLLRSAAAIQRDLEQMPLVDAVHNVEAKQWNKQPLSTATLRSILALQRELHAQHYDIAIDLQGTLRSAVIARMSGATKVLGSASPREGIARLLYGIRVQRKATHVVDQAAELVDTATLQLALRGSGSTAQAGSLKAHTDGTLLPQDREAESEWLRLRQQLCAPRPLVLLAATAGWGAKEWPQQKFAALAAALVTRGFCVLLNAPPGQPDPVTAAVLRLVASQFPVEAPHIQALCATLPVLIAATREAVAVVAGDTGPLHLAEALGKPTIGLFGPTDPLRTGPRRHSVCLRDAASVTDHRRNPQTESGLARIPLESVLEAFDSLVGSSHGNSAR